MFIGVERMALRGMPAGEAIGIHLANVTGTVGDVFAKLPETIHHMFRFTAGCTRRGRQSPESPTMKTVSVNRERDSQWSFRIVVPSGVRHPAPDRNDGK
jgi:hypothetical protein